MLGAISSISLERFVFRFRLSRGPACDLRYLPFFRRHPVAFSRGRRLARKSMSRNPHPGMHDDETFSVPPIAKSVDRVHRDVFEGGVFGLVIWLKAFWLKGKQALHVPLASHCKDPDSGLIALLQEGVPTGILSELPSSQQGRQRADNLSDTSSDDIQLQQCTGNWAQAERDPALLRTLLEKEIQAGHVVPFEGDRAAAAKHWPQGVAIGKLNIVKAEGRDPRLVLDSTICKANTRCRIPEHVTLPSAHEVMKSFQHDDAYGNWTAVALDFKAARKTIKVKRSEQGTLLFDVEGKRFHCTVCHFGAKFSAYWWSRLGALITRVAHELLAPFPHRVWLYVDDLLALVQSNRSGKASMPSSRLVGLHQRACLLEEGAARP